MPVERAKLSVRKIAGGVSIAPQGAAITDDLTILPNPLVSSVYIKLPADADLEIAPLNGVIGLWVGASEYMRILPFGTDCILWNKINNYDTYFQTTGSGVIKFGTYTAGAATDSTGYITIKDAAGNVRKLMVQA